MRCPDCGAEIEEGSDLCLSCGSPVVDTPAARVARKDSASSPSLGSAPPNPGNAPRTGNTPASPSPGAAPAVVIAPLREPKTTTRGKRTARAAEPEPIRCPACGAPSRAARCPGDGTLLRSEE